MYRFNCRFNFQIFREEEDFERPLAVLIYSTTDRFRGSQKRSYSRDYWIDTINIR